jgi:4-hydroxy-3-polyprenylbenzoate decarboxylase
MFRTKNKKNFDMTCTSHRGRLNGLKYPAKGRTCLWRDRAFGGPTLDKPAALGCAANSGL